MVGTRSRKGAQRTESSTTSEALLKQLEAAPEVQSPARDWMAGKQKNCKLLPQVLHRVSQEVATTKGGPEAQEGTGVANTTATGGVHSSGTVPPETFKLNLAAHMANHNFESQPDLGGQSVAQLASSIRLALQTKLGSQPSKAETTRGTFQPFEGGGPGYVHFTWEPCAEVTEAAHAPTDRTVSVGKERGLVKYLTVPQRDAKQLSTKQERDTAGKNWYEMPAQPITKEVKQELRLLRLRGAYDPKRFYKSLDETKFPKYFQIGTVQNDALEFYGGRLTNKERKATVTEQLLADPQVTAARQRRYMKLQGISTSSNGVKKRKTGMPRLDKKKRRSKH